MTIQAYAWITILCYFIAILSLSYYRARGASEEDYLIGSRKSVWWLVTLGMVSDSLSGITYISVPGAVHHGQYAYLQIVFGQFFGYLFIALVLLPLYYRMKLISIYGYLGTRFGPVAQKIGAFFFVASRTFGSAARLYIAVLVLHHFFFSEAVSPLWSFVSAMVLILLYTYKGGIKSLVWTEAFQSLFLLAGVIVVYFGFFRESTRPIETLLAPKLFFGDYKASNFFLKQFLGGILITIGMTGLDQNIMQMNLSCKNIREAQKNMLSFGFVFVLVNLVFVSLGALTAHLYQQYGTPVVFSDQMLPNLIFHHFGAVPILFFILGLTAATFSSASTVLPALATSIEFDLLPSRFQKRIPVRTLHLLSAAFILGVIFVLYLMKTESLISVILRYAGFTYGPLLGLFAIGIFTRYQIHERSIPLAAFTSIGLTALLDRYSNRIFSSYQIGIELIFLNALSFAGLVILLSKFRHHQPDREASSRTVAATPSSRLKKGLE